jgi:hypothetical protein
MQDLFLRMDDAKRKLSSMDDLSSYATDRIKSIIKKMEGLKMLKQMNELKQLSFEWRQEIKAYKAQLENPTETAKKLLAKARNLPAFQEFFKKHSKLAELFNLQGNDNLAITNGSLQTRTSVLSLVQSRAGSATGNGSNIFGQGISAAKSQLNQIKDKINKLGGMNEEDAELSDYKPRNQKFKSIFQRLEYGSNIQSVKSGNMMPATTDLGISIGYKINDKSIAGIGVSYKIGWGENWNKIRVSNEGIGLRSFLDYKIKGAFFVSGGYEYNYQPITTVLNQPSSWNKSALLGVTKIISLKQKITKKAKIQLLWDLLAYQQGLSQQALKFRIGYNF